MDERRPPFFRLTENDQGGAAVVAALCTIVISSLVASIRFLVAARQQVEFQQDDIAFYTGGFLASATSICVFRAVLVGLGQRIEILTPEKIDAYYKLMYTCQLLGILSMAASKTSVVMLFKRIAQTANRSYKGGLIMVALWGIFAFLVIAFQCQLPKPWVFIPSQCNTHGYLQYPVIILNILTDVLLATGIFPTIWKLNLKRDTRITVMILFGMRIVVPALAIGELVAVANSIKNVDQTWVNLARAIWLMLVTHCSLITATIPRTHSFWSSLQSGKTNAAITEQEFELSSGHSPFNSRLGSSKHPFSKISKHSKDDMKKSNNSSMNQSKSWSSSRDHELSRSRTKAQTQKPETLSPNGVSEEHLHLVPNNNVNIHTRVYTGVGHEPVMGGNDDDDTSQSSLKQSHIADFGVWTDREVRIEVEYVGNSSKTAVGTR
ncbi:hypothetical protein BGZ60DRAFT_409771 [Tricladium varicosporioides]|nr:hypothetical protein BGZ60DRAFT_409771 [Hymenoscyphus varicosporioides]